MFADKFCEGMKETPPGSLLQPGRESSFELLVSPTNGDAYRQPDMTPPHATLTVKEVLS